MTNHHAVVYWYIRNTGAKGFGPFADICPRRVIEIRDKKWQLLPGFVESDIDELSVAELDVALSQKRNIAQYH